MSSANIHDSFSRFARNFGNKIEPSVRHHLLRVYACLAATTACASIGAFFHLLAIWEAGILTALGSLGLAVFLSMTVDNGKNFYQRLGMLLGFGFLSGNSLGPLLEHVIHLNPAIIVTALVGTCVVFISLSCASLLADRGSYLFIGGLAMSVLSTMAMFSLANLFVQSTMIYQAQLYIGLFVMCGFVLFDTQAIMEKRRAGSTDYVKHSLDLFFDIAAIFRRLLIILTQKEEREQRKRKSQ